MFLILLYSYVGFKTNLNGLVLSITIVTLEYSIEFCSKDIANKLFQGVYFFFIANEPIKEQF